MNRLKSLFGGAKQIYRTEGLVPLLKRGFSFASSFMFKRQDYYLYRDPIQGSRLPNEVDVLPRVDDWVLKVVTSNREADEFEADGFEFRSKVINARERLDRGATAFCIYVGRELAHIGWLALTQEAVDSLGGGSFEVRLADHEAYSSGIWTNPKYRRLGIHKYGYFKRLEFMLANGVRTERSVVDRGNVAPQQSNALGGMLPFPGPQAEGRYQRILWWKSWKERPFVPGKAGQCTG